MLLVLVLGLLPAAITSSAFSWGWRHGTLHPTEQERVDHEFDRIVRRLDAPAS